MFSTMTSTLVQIFTSLNITQGKLVMGIRNICPTLSVLKPR